MVRRRRREVRDDLPALGDGHGLSVLDAAQDRRRLLVELGDTDWLEGVTHHGAILLVF